MNHPRRHLCLTLVWFGVAITSLGTLALCTSRTIFRDWFIIRFGIRTFNTSLFFCFGIIIVGLILMISAGVPLLSHRLREQRQQKQKLAEERTYAENSTNPELTRKRLQQLQQTMPEANPIFKQCLQQMDHMDQLQGRLSTLIQSNDASYLKDTIDLLDKVEGRLCRTLRSIINLCVAANSIDHLDHAKVRQYLEDNQKKLSDSQALLDVSVSWINQYNNDHDADRHEVETWIATIRESLKEE